VTIAAVSGVIFKFVSSPIKQVAGSVRTITVHSRFGFTGGVPHRIGALRHPILLSAEGTRFINEFYKVIAGFRGSVKIEETGSIRRPVLLVTYRRAGCVARGLEMNILQILIRHFAVTLVRESDNASFFSRDGLCRESLPCTLRRGAELEERRF
jgi:hypothetical protein